MKVKAVIWYVPLELNHSSYIYTSLLEFAKVEKCIFKLSTKDLNYKGSLSVEFLDIKYANNYYSKVTYVDVLLFNDTIIKLAFDLNDCGYAFSQYAFDRADFVFKRTYIKEYIDKLPENLKFKILPLGMPFMVRPNELKSSFKLKLLFFKFRFKQFVKIDRTVLQRLKKYYIKTNKDWKVFVNTRTLNDFSNKKLQKENSLIFYQKRFFPSVPSTDVKEIHNQRIRIIRMLKKHFEQNFIGGLKKDSPITDEFSDCISSMEGNQLEFLKKMQSCGICIYTRGLTNSVGWTLPEFLSQGKCVIAEKTNVLFPFTLTNHENVLFYENEEEILEICSHLLNDEKMVEVIGQNAQKFYNKNVSPSIFFENVLIKINV